MSTLSERLAKARAKLFGPTAVDVPTPFELPCHCGHTVVGIRRPRIQITLCSACGQSLFVLPTDRYPPTRRTAPTTSHRTADPPAKAAPRTTPETPEPAPAAASGDYASPAKKKHRAPRRTAAAPNSPSANSSALDRSPPEVPANAEHPTSVRTAAPPPPPRTLAPPRPSIAVRMRRTFTPFRLLTTGCLALLILTAGWMLHQRQLENAVRTWRRELDTALNAETEGNRTALQDSLRKALAAADLLQKQDTDVAHARSLLRQCSAISQLTAVDPVAVLTTNSAPDQPPSPEKLTTELRGLVLLFDAPPQPAPDTPDGVLLDLPLVIHGRMLQLSARSEILRQSSRLFPGQSALFLAAIRSCSPSADPSGSLLLELDPDSITLLTSEFLATQAGLSTEHVPELAQILERQSGLIVPAAPGTLTDAAPKSDDSAKAATP